MSSYNSLFILALYHLQDKQWKEEILLEESSRLSEQEVIVVKENSLDSALKSKSVEGRKNNSASGSNNTVCCDREMEKLSSVEIKSNSKKDTNNNKNR